MSDELWNNPELQALSQQSIHYSQEEERQSQKLRKRAARESFSISSTSKKKQRLPKSIEQLKHQKEYTRIKYKKNTNYRNELDVNGSIEYLVRKKLNSRKEQKRLKRIVKERNDKRLHLDDDDLSAAALSSSLDDNNNTVAAAAKSGGGNDSVNWNYINEGYTTMPKSDAQKLSYYVYNNHNGRKRKRMQKNKLASNIPVDTQQTKMGAILEEEEVHSSSSISSTSTSTSRGRGSGGPRYKTSLEVAAR